MRTLIRSRALHLVLLALFIGLSQPSPLPSTVSTELKQQLQAEWIDPQLADTLARTSLLFPNWKRPAVLAFQRSIQSGSPEIARQIMDDHQAVKESANPCSMIQLFLAVDEPETAQQYWLAVPDACNGDQEALSPMIPYLLEHHEYTQAADIQTLIITESPEESDLHFQLAKIFSVYEPEKALAPLQVVRSITGEEDQLVNSLIRAIEDTRYHKNTAYTLANIGIQYAAHGDWVFARHALAHAVELEPDYAEALAYLGHALDESGLNGLSELQQGASIDPDSQMIWLLFARHWLRHNELDQAQDAVLKALDINPGNPAAHAIKGEILSQMGNHEGAVSAYLRACELEPQIPDFWLLLAEYSLTYEVKTSTLGIQAARRAVLLDPENARALDMLGFAHYLNGSFTAAERLLKRAASINPKSSSAHFHLGLAHLALDQMEPALQSLHQAVALNPDGHYGVLAARTLESLRP